MPLRPAAPVLIAVFFTMLPITARAETRIDLPYAEAGLTKQQAAAHLLERFAFGARPGDINRMVEIGLDKWLDAQLSGSLPDPKLEARLSSFQALAMSAREIIQTYPRDNMVRSQAGREGIIDLNNPAMDRAEIRDKMKAFAQERGYRPHRELLNELKAQKLLRALHSENQLIEALTNFWFNHFNVSVQDNQARTWILSYERDAIRPHVLGRFRDLLGATAKHPAMLFYLDNAQSTAPDRPLQMGMGGMNMGGRTPDRPRRRRGINENYARELMELHTLGVDGGYTQQDIVEVARAFTGWTLYPFGPREERIRKQIKRRPHAFVRQGDFLFLKNAHDAGEKIILEQTFPAGGGIEEGERVLDILARHPATARHLSHKLATRFVSDNPPDTLVNRLARTFLKTDGDIPALMRALAASPEFWHEAVQRTKIKSPFELAAGALRALEADVKNPRPALRWIARMGQPLYAYQQPTGYPDRAEAWMNAGTLVTRMNFGLDLALGRIRGIRIDLRPPDRDDPSDAALLETYAALLLPGQDLPETLRELAPTIPVKPDKQAAKAVGLILGSPEFQYH